VRTERGDFDYITVLDQTTDRMPDTLEVSLDALPQEQLLDYALDGLFGLRLVSQILQNHKGNIILVVIYTIDHKDHSYGCHRSMATAVPVEATNRAERNLNGAREKRRRRAWRERPWTLLILLPNRMRPPSRLTRLKVCGLGIG
jgi:hypothetical protein